MLSSYEASFANADDDRRLIICTVVRGGYPDIEGYEALVAIVGTIGG